MSTARCSHSPPCAADGRTVGGSADGVVLFFAPAADCRADRLTFQFRVVQEGRGRGGLQGFSGQGSTASFGGDRVDIPGGGLQGSRPGQGSASSSSSLDHAGQGFFRTFPRGKKARGKVRTRGRN